MNRDEYLSKLAQRDIISIENCIKIVNRLSMYDKYIKPSVLTSGMSSDFHNLHEEIKIYLTLFSKNIVLRINNLIDSYKYATLSSYHQLDISAMIAERISIVEALQNEIGSYQELLTKLK